MVKRPLTVFLVASCAVAAGACSSQPGTAKRAAVVRSTRPASAALSPSPAPPAAVAGRNCPAQPILPPGADASRLARTAARAAVPKVYTDIRIGGFEILQAAAATRSTALGSVPYGMCGGTVGTRTWVVQIAFPLEKPSADLSHGVLFMGRFAGGWRVWFRWQ
jgi:hypothetical protein